jgi:hypothetical protein
MSRLLLQRGLRRLLILRQRSNGNKLNPDDAEEALQTMLPSQNKVAQNGGPAQAADPRITGEVCLLQDSPYRILRVSLTRLVLVTF